MAAWKEFKEGEALLNLAVSSHSRVLGAQRLAAIAKKHGKTSPRYFHKKVTIDARVLLNLMEKQSKLKEPDMEKITAETKKLNDLVVEMSTKTKGKRLPGGFSSFVNASNDYVGVCKEMMRGLKNLKKKKRSRWRKRSYAKIIEKFNDLIGRANFLMYR